MGQFGVDNRSSHNNNIAGSRYHFCWMVHKGVGVERSKAEAFVRFTLAASQGHDLATKTLRFARKYFNLIGAAASGHTLNLPPFLMLLK